MNLSILILPALLGTLAASAVHTLPADLRHDAAGKAPLAVARMAVARGAGSTCRLGCTLDNNVPCHVVMNIDGSILCYESQVWYPHMECGYAWGSDGCQSVKDVLCNQFWIYGATDSTCSQGGNPTAPTTTSLCVVSLPPVPPS